VKQRLIVDWVQLVCDAGDDDIGHSGVVMLEKLQSER
jgi:hypothetical protein